MAYITIQQLIDEWDDDKNKQYDKHSDIPVGKPVWWKGKCGHSWDAPISSRLKRYETKGYIGGCPYCCGRRVLQGFNDVVTTYPDIVKWHDGDIDILYNISKGSKKKLNFKCPQGHIFSMPVKNFTSGRRCNQCRLSDPLENNKEFLSYWSSNNDDISLYTRYSKHRAEFICPNNSDHIWRMGIDYFYTHMYCPFCNKKLGYADTGVISEKHPELINYWSSLNKSHIDYFTEFSFREAWWKCPQGKHDDFPKRIDTVNIHGLSCPECNETYPESFIRNVLDNTVGRDSYVYRTRKIIPPRELDFYIPGKKIAIEVNGIYWHSHNIIGDKEYHAKKYHCCKENGIQLLTIWEDDIVHKPDIVKNLLHHKMGFSTQQRIYARNAYVASISYDKAQDFLSKNHIQGAASGTMYLGLFTKEDQTLCAVCVIKKQNNGTYLLTRYATNNHVVGGLGKLLSYVKKRYPGITLVTFSDNCISDGSVYKKLGFNKEYSLHPDYSYIYQNKRQHKFLFRKKRFKDDPNLIYKENLTERELAEINGIPRIYDCGKVKYSIEL